MKKLIRFFTIAALVSFSQNLLAEESSLPSTTPGVSLAATTNDANTTAGSNNATTGSNTNNTTTKKPVSMSSVVQQLQKAGYIVKSIDFDKDNNEYKADAIDRHGDKQSLKIDATKGLSADQKKMPHEMSLAQVIKKYEKNGTYVKSASMDNNTYKITTVDNNGKQQEYTVDMQTGKSTS
jgi:uncharacterized protein YxeA